MGNDKRKATIMRVDNRKTDECTCAASEALRSYLTPESRLSLSSSSPKLAWLSYLAIRTRRSGISGSPTRALLSGLSNVTRVTRRALYSKLSSEASKTGGTGKASWTSRTYKEKRQCHKCDNVRYIHMTGIQKVLQHPVLINKLVKTSC